MKRKIYITLIVISTLAIAATIFILNYNYSEGVRSGRVVKMTEKGALIKTFEGTLDLGYSDKLTWDFSVHSKELGKQMESHIGKKITVQYNKKFFRLWWDTAYNVTSFKIEQENADWEQDFCSLVNHIRSNQMMVENLKSLLESKEPGLLEKVRNCQNKL